MGEESGGGAQAAGMGAVSAGRRPREVGVPVSVMEDVAVSPDRHMIVSRVFADARRFLEAELDRIAARACSVCGDPSADDGWVANGPHDPTVEPVMTWFCPRHMADVKRFGVDFDADGRSVIRQPLTGDEIRQVRRMLAAAALVFPETSS